MLIVSSHHATDSLSQLANQKPAFVGERCILKNSGGSCRLSFSSLFPSPLPRFSRAKRISKTNLFDFNPTGEPASRLGDNLKTISYPLSLWFCWATVGIWFSGHTVGNTNELELTDHRKIMENMDKNSKYWGFMEPNEAIKDTVQHWCW